LTVLHKIIYSHALFMHKFESKIYEIDDSLHSAAPLSLTMNIFYS